MIKLAQNNKVDLVKVHKIVFIHFAVCASYNVFCPYWIREPTPKSTLRGKRET